MRTTLENKHHNVFSNPAAIERIEKQVISISTCCMKLSFSSWPPRLSDDFYVLFATASAIKKALEQKTVISHIVMKVSPILVLATNHQFTIFQTNFSFWLIAVFNFDSGPKLLLTLISERDLDV